LDAADQLVISCARSTSSSAISGAILQDSARTESPRLENASDLCKNRQVLLIERLSLLPVSVSEQPSSLSLEKLFLLLLLTGLCFVSYPGRICSPVMLITSALTFW